MFIFCAALLLGLAQPEVYRGYLQKEYPEVVAEPTSTAEELRALKIAADLRRLCGDLRQKRIAYVASSAIDFSQEYDVLICPEFSSLAPSLQQACVQLMQRVPYGWLGIDALASSPFPCDELVRLLYNAQKAGKVTKEEPSPEPRTLQLIWCPTFPQKIHKTAEFSTRGNGITYSFSGGRLGDNLVAYFHALWLAYKYQLPLVYVPFQNAELFHLHEMYPPRNMLFEQSVIFTHEEQLKNHTSTLFTVPYFSEPPETIQPPLFPVDWQDPEFRALVADSLTPKNPVSTLPLPRDRLTVGVHVRRGEVVNAEHMKAALPLKFPPDSYYIEQIRRLTTIFKNQPLYIFILTDDRDPWALVRTYREALNNPLLEFACRESNGGHAFLEDFLSIPTFDCLILCQSNFSLMSAKLSDYGVLITPTHAVAPPYVKKKKKKKTPPPPVTIDEVEVIFNPHYRSNLKLNR